jgi:hypothetical protein
MFSLRNNVSTKIIIEVVTLTRHEQPTCYMSVSACLLPKAQSIPLYVYGLEFGC